MLAHLPNALTIARILSVPVIIWCIWFGEIIAIHGYKAASADASLYRTAAVGVFVFAALTDLFDGWAARTFNAESKLGRILDPIADKALVGLPLMTLFALTAMHGNTIDVLLLGCPVFIIIGRDLAITLIRLRATDGEGVRVSTLAKYKTALELIAVGLPLLLALPGIGFTAPFYAIWMSCLWLAAGLSAYTGAAYLR